MREITPVPGSSGLLSNGHHVGCFDSSGSEDPAVEGVNDDSASQQLSGSRSYDESGEQASSSRAGAALPLARSCCQGRRHSTPFYMADHSTAQKAHSRATKVKFKTLTLQLYTLIIFFFPTALNTSNKHEN